MAADPAVIDLRHGGDLPWRSMTIPDSTPDVELARLHADQRTRASVALVRFPSGWARPGAGHYHCAEQFVVLDGALEVSGILYVAGDYAYLPASTVRTQSRSPGGCLAVACFSGLPDWSAGPPATSANEPAVRGRVKDLDRRTGVGGGTYGCRRVAATPVDITTELLWPESGLWCLLRTGTMPPSLPGPVLLRQWP